MKKIFILITIATATFFSGCSDEDFAEQYRDPSKVTQASIENFFTGILQEAAELLRPGYMKYLRTYPNFGSISQTWGNIPVGSGSQNGFYPVNTDSWGWYLRTATQWKICNRQWIADGEEADKEVYVLCGKAVMFQTMLQALDVHGKLPYSQLGLYVAEGTLEYANLDDTKQLYEMILDELGEINTKLASATGTVATMTDWLNDGDMAKWRVYVNSLRLRAAIRLSGCELHPELNNTGTNQPDAALTSKAQNVVKEILNNAGANPVVTGESDEIAITNRGAGDQWWQSITTRDRYTDWPASHTASQPLLDRLDRDGSQTVSAGDDPRLNLFFDPSTVGGKFVGIAPTDDASEVSGNLGEDSPFSYVNERSFRQNHNFKSYIITPTEIAYYKAEAILRFGVSGDAKAEFARGFVASVKMFADINEQSDCSTLSYLTRSPLVVDAAWKAQWADYGKSFAEGLWDAASDKLALVYEQFWVHNWLFGTLESWNSVRRTGVPDLIYPYFADGNPIQVVPAREIIPADEHSKNPNIPDETVTSYTPDKAYWETLFWAKDLTKSPNCKKP